MAMTTPKVLSWWNSLRILNADNDSENGGGEQLLRHAQDGLILLTEPLLLQPSRWSVWGLCVLVNEQFNYMLR